METSKTWTPVEPPVISHLNRQERLRYLTRFEIFPEHLALLQRAHISWEACEYGAPSIDCKRPYGNSSVAWDIFEILRWDVPSVSSDEAEDFYESERYEHLSKQARLIHEEIAVALQIVLVTGCLETGIYVRDDQYSSTAWKKEVTS